MRPVAVTRRHRWSSLVDGPFDDQERLGREAIVQCGLQPATVTFPDPIASMALALGEHHAVRAPAEYLPRFGPAIAPQTRAASPLARAADRPPEAHRRTR